MRKLYRKSTVHPTLTSSISDHHQHHLSCFLPAAIFTLTVALTPEDREVLAYLLSGSCSTSNNNSNLSSSCSCEYKRLEKNRWQKDEHFAMFSCRCFRCYMSYWIRWDSSPNRQLIHEIIDAYEDDLVKKNSSSSSSISKKNRRNKKAAASAGKKSSLCVSELTRTEFDSVKDVQTGVAVVDDNEDGKGYSDEDDGLEIDGKGGSMRKFVSFIGDKIWGGVFGAAKHSE